MTSRTLSPDYRKERDNGPVVHPVVYGLGSHPPITWWLQTDAGGKRVASAKRQAITKLQHVLVDLYTLRRFPSGYQASRGRDRSWSDFIA